MLKLTYTENGFVLELLDSSLEEWVSTRVLLALRSGTNLHLEASSASFLLPLDLPYLAELKAMGESESMSLSPCDAEYLEVCLEGNWLSSNLEIEEGVFVCSLGKPRETSLYQLWQEAKVEMSIISE